MAQIGVVADAVDPRRDGKRRVHQHHRGPDVAQPVGDGFRVERGHNRLREQLRQQPRPRLRVFIEMEAAVGVLAERAFRHYRQHPGAGRGFQHGVARPDRGGLEGGIGERQRGRELLEPDLLLGPPGVRGLQRGDGPQHGQHAARPVRREAASLAHAPAVALEEQHGGGLGGLVGVLPEPGAHRVRSAEGVGHGVPEDRGIERPARLQNRQQGPGRGEQGVAPGPDGPALRAGRWRWREETGARARPAPDGRRAWRSPCWKGPALARRESSHAGPPDCPRPAGRPDGAETHGDVRLE